MKRAILLLAAIAATYVFLTEQNIFVCFAAVIVAGGALVEAFFSKRSAKANLVLAWSIAAVASIAVGGLLYDHLIIKTKYEFLSRDMSTTAD